MYITTGKERGWGLAYKKHSYSIIYYALGHAAGTQCSPPLLARATPESPSPRLIIFQRHPSSHRVRICVYTRIPYMYHYTTTTAHIYVTTTTITAVRHYTITAMYTYTTLNYNTTTNTYVYNICEGIVGKKIAQVRER